MKHFKSSALALVMTLSCFAGNTYANDFDPNAIRIRDAAPVANTASAKVIDISVKPSKNIYRVGESIKFKVTGKEDYYLYVFTIDPVSKDSVQLLPNAKTQDNRLKKNKTYNIPGTVDFYSDAAGVEQIVFVATREPIDLSSVQTKQMGAFSVGNIDDVSSAFSSKAIRLRDPATTSTPQPATQGVQVLKLQIVQ